MLHLAQVQKKGFLGKAELRLLASQKSETTWTVIAEEDTLPSSAAEPFGEGVLVLVELDDQRQVLTITEATEWVLDFVQKYLSIGITPAFLQQEA